MNNALSEQRRRTQKIFFRSFDRSFTWRESGVLWRRVKCLPEWVKVYVTHEWKLTDEFSRPQWVIRCRQLTHSTAHGQSISTLYVPWKKAEVEVQRSVLRTIPGNAWRHCISFSSSFHTGFVKLRFYLISLVIFFSRVWKVLTMPQEICLYRLARQSSSKVAPYSDFLVVLNWLFAVSFSPK